MVVVGGCGLIWQHQGFSAHSLRRGTCSLWPLCGEQADLLCCSSFQTSVLQQGSFLQQGWAMLLPAGSRHWEWEEEPGLSLFKMDVDGAPSHNKPMNPGFSASMDLAHLIFSLRSIEITGFVTVSGLQRSPQLSTTFSEDLGHGAQPCTPLCHTERRCIHMARSWETIVSFRKPSQ